MMEDTKTEAVIFNNYKSDEDLNIGTRDIKVVEFHKSEFETIPAELLNHQELQNLIFNRCIFTHVENLKQLKVCQNITKLTLKKCNLQTFPEFLSEFHILDSRNLSGNSFRKGSLDSIIKLRRLEYLDLSGCILQDFPVVLTTLRRLKRLNIDRNVQVCYLSESLENLTNVETLNMRSCGFTEFPKVLCKLKSLKTLDIGENENIRNLPNTLENLTNLETLNMCQCCFTEFPQVLCKLKSLKTLHTDWNENFRNLPNTLGNLTNLETLNMWGCGLTEFPKVLCKLKSLKTLHIGWNKNIRNLPNTLKNLTNLQTLNVLNCGLTKFPKVLCKLKSLKTLHIDWNENIRNLPNTLKNLTNLQTLNVSNCGLTEFPQVLCKHKSLKTLLIGWNENIRNLPNTLENLTNLETLDVSNCGLTEFPQVLCKHKSLKTLDIRENKNIRNLPNTLENLTNLQTLNVSNCGLTKFPQVACRLKSLKTSVIRRNENIRNLPNTLENLTNLEILNTGECGLTGFPQVLCKIKSLQYLDISRNPLKELPTFIFKIKWLYKLDVSDTSITCLPRVIERCEYLEKLNVCGTQIKEFPTVIFRMKNLRNVIANNVSIEVLDENFVKLWSQRREVFTKGRFLKVVGLRPVSFVKPPNEIVRRGPEACMKYYRALKADDAVNCSIINVTLMGKTGAGKSSLILSIKEGYSVLVDPSDRTVVVDTLEVKHEDVLLKITDFGGHDIYEITCPLFLRSTKQVAIIAVKVQEYNENKHDELVTKWLTTAVSHMKNGSVCIVATQCDLCTEDEVEEKMRILKKKVDNWIEEETSFRTKLRPHQPKMMRLREIIFDKKNIHYFQSSSLTMKGIHDVEDFLFREAKLSRLVLPERWTEVYKKMDTQTGLGAHFLTEIEYQTLFNTTYPSPVIPDNEESLQCLQFLHDSGMVLWYGEKHDNLRKIIFHDPSFPVSVLQCLFRHDLADVLEYDHEQFGQYFTLKYNFQREVGRFIKTGILSSQLLRCVWQKFKFSQEEVDIMVKMLTMLDICFVDGEKQDDMLRLPWFVQDEDMNFLKTLWPEKLPPNTVQYTLTYCFCHRIPGVIYERFCVTLQRHLQAGAHTRQDRKDAVYIEQNGVQIFSRDTLMDMNLTCKSI